MRGWVGEQVGERLGKCLVSGGAGAQRRNPHNSTRLQHPAPTRQAAPRAELSWARGLTVHAVDQHADVLGDGVDLGDAGGVGQLVGNLVLQRQIGRQARE